MHTHEREVSITTTTPTIDLELFKMNVYRIKNRMKNRIKSMRIRKISKIERHR